MGGHAVLGAKFCASVFLYARIFSSDRAAVKPPAQPNGFVPSWDWGGAAPSLQAAGGDHGLDCLLAIFFRVFSVKVRGHFVISLYFLGLLVTVHPPLERNFQALLGLHRSKKKLVSPCKKAFLPLWSFGYLLHSALAY
jgi:hypothetical protein